MKIVPEVREETLDCPSAPPGDYTMRFVQIKENVGGKPKDVCDFTDGKFGASFWIHGPNPEEGRKGNLWKYRHLAEALGDDAAELYPQTDADGVSLFHPTDFVGRWCKVVVGEYGIDQIDRADPAVVAALKNEAKPDQTAKITAGDDVPF